MKNLPLKLKLLVLPAVIFITFIIASIFFNSSSDNLNVLGAEVSPAVTTKPTVQIKYSNNIEISSPNFKATVSKDQVNKLIFENGDILKLSEELIEKNNNIRKEFGLKGEIFEYKKNKTNWSKSELITELSKVVDKFKLNQAITTQIILTEQDVAGTDGILKPRYIEVDTTRQKVYGWENGKIVKEFFVSGGIPGYEAWGVHQMMNKDPRAWSDIAEKWMPYWMAFYYDPNQKAYYGFHQLVNWTDKHGNYYEEPESRLFQRVSLGCVRLKSGESKEFYDWVKIGDTVLIHK